MNRIATFLILACLASSLTGCAHQQAITDGLEDVSLDCAKGVQPAVLPAIESALASGDWKGQLELIAGKTAVCVVSKGVAYVLDELTTGHASKDAFALSKARHAQNWLEIHPVN
jgi:hypothetical protein